MLNSRDISKLRPDVAANCKILIAEMKELGYPVGVMTVRDDEYQMDCFKRGTGSKPPATFHSVHAGLAFDVFQNIKGQEYTNSELFRQAGIIGKRLGFTWGGGWSKFPDKPHFQWDAHGKFTGSDIVARRYPPTMPLFKQEEEEMNQEQFDVFMQNYLNKNSQKPVATWAKTEFEKATSKGIMDGKRPCDSVSRQEVAIILDRLKLI